MLDLATPVTHLSMVGPAYSLRLKKLGITTVRDLLYHIPSRYIDYSLTSPINKLQPGEQVSVKGTISSIKTIYTRSKTSIQKLIVEDTTGTLEVIFYNQPYLLTVLKKGTEVTFAGIVELNGFHLSMQSPEFEISVSTKQSIHTGRLVPVYPLTHGVSSKWLRSRIYSLIAKFTPDIKEYLAPDILKEFNLWEERKSLYQIHFPKDPHSAQKARERLSLDELLELHIASQFRANAWKKIRPVQKIDTITHKKSIQQLIASLPFTLTQAQETAINEILAELEKDHAMNRLLLGDVGAGKTVVSAVAAYVVAKNGFQTLLMAPTQILAQQHYETMINILSQQNLSISLVTSQSKPADLSGVDIIVGTHALLTQKLKKSKIALVVIDEQQRFGVEQRALLRKKGRSAHLLTMTATPIPRTIALTLYADLSLSVLDQLPQGRLPVKTWVVPAAKRQAAYQWIHKLVIDRRTPQQAFIVCPFIEESESMDTVKAATVEYERLQKQVFTDLKLGLLHGRMKKVERETTLGDFRNGKINILVATPVVEVGIDIPKATIMVIEASDRFGLSQLHQLRGRVGRSTMQSYCLLFTEVSNERVLDRLKLLERFHSGPKLAEMDLSLRGAGDIYGTRQHGLSDIKIADITDKETLMKAIKIAKRLSNDDPTFLSFPYLHKRLEAYTIKNISQD